jgi:quercetin dioxygenase-like cupin family protein
MKELLAITGPVSIDKVERLEQALSQMDQVEIPVVNYFSHKIYAREITIPKNTILTGKIHKYSQLNILSKGEISVLTEDGVKRVKAPFTIVSPPGTKRAAYAHEDCVWTTIHGTDETDVEKIENHFIAKDMKEYLEFKESLLIEETKVLEEKK